MLHYLPVLTEAQRAIRGSICPTCPSRTVRGDEANCRLPRACEANCTLALFLPQLLAIAARTDLSEPGAIDAAVRKRICQQCPYSPSAGDYCAERLTRTCPLSRHAERAVEVLEKVIRHRQLWKAARPAAPATVP